MIVLDTGHLTVLKRGGSQSLPLQLRLSQIPPGEIATTIVNCWTRITACRPTSKRLLEFRSFHSTRNQPRDSKRFTPHAFESAPLDPRIAEITLANSATLLTKNLADFESISDLVCEDWTA